METIGDLGIYAALDYPGGTVKICKEIRIAQVCDEKSKLDRRFRKVTSGFLEPPVSKGLRVISLLSALNVCVTCSTLDMGSLEDITIWPEHKCQEHYVMGRKAKLRR